MDKVIKLRNESFEGYILAAILKVLNDDLAKIRVKYETKMEDEINIRFYSSKIDIDSNLNPINVNDFGDPKAYIELNFSNLNCNIEYVLNENIDEKKFKEVEKDERKSLRRKFFYNEGFPKEYLESRESIKLNIVTANAEVTFEIACSWEYFDNITNKVVKRKDELLSELEENGFVDEVLLEDNEFNCDYDPDDRSKGSCSFCGNRTYDGDILCPDCANNVD